MRAKELENNGPDRPLEAALAVTAAMGRNVALSVTGETVKQILDCREELPAA